MGFLSALLPSDTKFYGMFEGVGVNVKSAAALVEEFTASKSAAERAEIAARLKEVEHLNDVATHEIFNELHSSFIIPFDREDIHALAAVLDDIIDYSTDSLLRTALYEMEEITPAAKRQFGVLCQAMRAVCEIIDRLRELKDLTSIAANLQEVHRIENEGDTAYSEALGELFRNGKDPIFIVKWKDLHSIVEKAIDSCERAADVAEGIGIKHA